MAKAKTEAVSGVRVSSTPLLSDSSAGSGAQVIRNAEVLVNGKVVLRQNSVTGEYEIVPLPRLLVGSGDALRESSGRLPPLRQAYVDDVRALEDIGLNMRVAGATAEQVARQLHQMRRDIGVQYKKLTPPAKLEEIYARNTRRYGDKLGPSIDRLRAEGKSWEDIIGSASRPGGEDMGF